MAPPSTPIEVNPSQLPGGAATLLRYALTAAGTAMVTNHVLPADSNVNNIVGAVLVVVSTGYGMWRTWHNKREAVTMAAAAPDRVAVVKGS
jgi:hypothetical protein